MANLWIPDDLKTRLEDEARKRGFHIGQGGGSQRGDFITWLLDANAKTNTIIGYLQEFAEKSDGDVQEAYWTALAWFELAGLVQGKDKE